MPDILEEHVLSRGGAALHPIDDHRVGPRLHREHHVVVGAGRTHLHVDRLLPAGDLAKLADLDLEIVGARPVGMARRTALIDPRGQGPHLGHAIGDLLPEQHPAAPGLRPLSHHHFDGVGAAKLIRPHAVARGQVLVDEGLRCIALLVGHAAVTGGGAGSHGGRGEPQRALGVRAERSEAHARDGDRNGQLDRPRCMAGADGDVRRALLTVAFERIAGDRGAEKDEIVEARHRPLRAGPPNGVDPFRTGALDLRDDVRRKRRRGPDAAFVAHRRVPRSVIARAPHALSMFVLTVSVAPRAAKLEVVESRRATPRRRSPRRRARPRTPYALGLE